MQADLLLLGGLLPLLVGPLFATWADGSEVVKAAMDAFTTVTLGGIVILHIWPHAFLTAGSWALVSGLLGLCLPFLLHGPLHAHEERIYPGILVVAFFGLVVHAGVDGVALFSPQVAEEHLIEHPLDESSPDSAQSAEQAEHDHHQESATLLGLAVILHRLPLALAVWWFAVPIFGRRGAAGILAAIAVATILGFIFAGRLLVALSVPGIAIFESVVAGMLVHVVLGHEHGHAHHPEGESSCRASALGTLTGLGLLVGLGALHPLEQSLMQELSFSSAFQALANRISPPLFLGLVVTALFAAILWTGLLQRAVGPVWNRWSQRSAWNSQILAGVAPELAVPTFLISLSLLGPRLTLLRGLGVGLSTAVLFWLGRNVEDVPKGREQMPAPCPFFTTFWRWLELSAGRLLPWALMILVTISLLEPMVRLDGINSFSQLVAFSSAALLGALVYLHPLAGALIAFLLLHMEWSPELVLVFLLTGSSIGVVRHQASQTSTGWLKLLPLVLLGSVLPTFWLSRLVLPIATPGPSFHQLATVPMTPITWVSLIGLSALALIQLFKSGLRGFLRPIFDPSRGMTVSGEPARPCSHG